MSVILSVLLILVGLTIMAAVSAWGAVQALRVMDGLDLRREKKAKKLQEARKYLSSPETYQVKGNYTWTDNTGNTGMSNPMNTWTN